MGRRHLGPYRILDELGQGGMGQVFLAEVEEPIADLGAGSRVALKVIHPHLLETPGFFKRFLREAQIGRSVTHPNVVRCHDCDAIRTDGEYCHYLVMEYVEGQTLRALAEDLGTVPEELCRHVAREIARGLDGIHAAGVVHRDLKPENVLITDDHAVKIMDLGVAHLQDEAIRLSQSGVFMGSVLYAAPEAFRSTCADIDGRADLYALGVLLYELAVGRHPHEDTDVRVMIRQVLEEEPRRAGTLNPQLSPLFEEVVHTLLAKKPEERFASAADVLAVLEEGEDSAWWRERAQAIQLRTQRPLRRIRIPRETAVYGREGELARLQTAYEDARSGYGRVLLLEGEAGIGKTRLVDEFVRQLEEQGEDANFLFGSYPPGGAATGAGAFSTAYREHFGVGALEESLHDYLGATPLLIPAFAALLRGEPPPPGEEALTRDSLQTVFIHASRALAEERPTIVVIDDLHFAPDEGRALFATLALAVAEHRILLIGSMRRGVTRPWVQAVEALGHADRIVLHRLGAKDLARLLEDAFRSKRLATELGHEIAVKSDGNPFFAFEIICGLKEGLFITQASDGSWQTTKAIRNIQVPSSIVDLVQARMTSLTQEERDLLDVAACCGYEFDPEWIAEALQIPIVPALKAFGRIERMHRLVRTMGRDLVFDHHHVQESLYESLIPQLREAYHAALADALEKRVLPTDGAAEDIDGRLEVLLCRHFLKARQGARALPHLHAAVDHLEEGYLNASALDLLDLALAEDGLLVGEERIRSLVRKTGRLELLGRREDQRAAIDEALALLDEDTDASVAIWVRTALGTLLDDLAEYDEAQQIFEASVAEAAAAEDQHGEAVARGHLGNVLYARGRYAEARAEYEACRDIAREIGDRRQEAMAIGSLGNIYGMEGRFPEAQRCFEDLVALSQEAGERRGEGGGYGNLGVVALLQGRYEEAQGYFERRLSIAQETGDRQGEAYAIGHLGTTLLQLGRSEEACESCARYLAISEEMGDRQGQAMAAGYLGDAYRALGRNEEACALFARQLRIAEEIREPLAALRGEHGLGDTYLALGRLEEAKEKLEEALQIARQLGDRHAVGHARRDLADVWLLLGGTAEARGSLEDALAIASDPEDAYAKSAALQGLARVHAHDGSLDRACEVAREALTLSRTLEARAELARALNLLGRLETTSGRAEEATRNLDEALEIARSAGATVQALEAGIQRLGLLGGDPGAVRAELTTCEERLPHAERMDAYFRLWRAAGDPSDLAEARRLLDHLVAHAPAAFREAMVEDVPLHREIVEATRQGSDAS